MNETDTDTTAVGDGKIIHLDEAHLRDHVRKITRSIEETHHKLRDAKGGRLCGDITL